MLGFNLYNVSRLEKLSFSQSVSVISLSEFVFKGISDWNDI